MGDHGSDASVRLTSNQPSLIELVNTINKMFTCLCLVLKEHTITFLCQYDTLSFLRHKTFTLQNRIVSLRRPRLPNPIISCFKQRKAAYMPIPSLPLRCQIASVKGHIDKWNTHQYVPFDDELKYRSKEDCRYIWKG